MRGPLSSLVPGAPRGRFRWGCPPSSPVGLYWAQQVGVEFPGLGPCVSWYHLGDWREKGSRVRLGSSPVAGWLEPGGVASGPSGDHDQTGAPSSSRTSSAAAALQLGAGSSYVGRRGYCRGATVTEPERREALLEQGEGRGGDPTRVVLTGLCSALWVRVSATERGEREQSGGGDVLCSVRCGGRTEGERRWRRALFRGSVTSARRLRRRQVLAGGWSVDGCSEVV